MGDDDKRVVLHVGAHKTGTTLIQQYLAAHRRVLRRHGVRYVPRTELTPLVGWGEKLVDAPVGFGALLEDFAADRARVLLGSHENICGHPIVAGGGSLYPRASGPLEALAGLLSGVPTTIVLTVRPPHELLESYYLQQVNLGTTAPFERWLAGVDLDALSWQPLVDTLHRSFGADAVELVDFGRLRGGSTGSTGSTGSADSLGYVSEVLRRARVAVPLDHAWVRPLNPSVSEQGMRLLLRGNAALDDPADRAAVRRFVQRHFSNATGARPELLDPAVRAVVRDRYADEYATLVAGPA